MFLLIQQATKVRLSGKLTLHSNMFLLIHRPARWSCTANDFTFQYVSINTEKTCTLGWAQNYFTFQYVSINTCSSISRSASASNFTFQYVSINTWWNFYRSPWFLSLHSNMFLLIHDQQNMRLYIFQTLHSNMFLLILYPRYWRFRVLLSLHSNMFLLIPNSGMTNSRRR